MTLDLNRVRVELPDVEFVSPRLLAQCIATELAPLVYRWRWQKAIMEPGVGLQVVQLTPAERNYLGGLWSALPRLQEATAAGQSLGTLMRADEFARYAEAFEQDPGRPAWSLHVETFSGGPSAQAEIEEAHLQQLEQDVVLGRMEALDRFSVPTRAFSPDEVRIRIELALAYIERCGHTGLRADWSKQGKTIGTDAASSARDTRPRSRSSSALPQSEPVRPGDTREATKARWAHLEHLKDLAVKLATEWDPPLKSIPFAAAEISVKLLKPKPGSNGEPVSYTPETVEGWLRERNWKPRK